jgi:hypothetical protein
LACSAILYEDIHGWKASWSMNQLWSTLLDFADDTSDTILFALFRVLAMIALGFTAMRVGVPNFAAAERKKSEDMQGLARLARQPSASLNAGLGDRTLSAPLLASHDRAAAQARQDAALASIAEDPASASASSAAAAAATETKEDSSTAAIAAAAAADAGDSKGDMKTPLLESKSDAKRSDDAGSSASASGLGLTNGHGHAHGPGQAHDHAHGGAAAAASTAPAGAAHSHAHSGLSDAEKFVLQTAADRRKTAALTALFILSTWGQVQTGIKTVTFDFDQDNLAVQAALMASAIFWINVQVSVSVRLRSPTAARASLLRLGPVLIPFVCAVLFHQGGDFGRDARHGLPLQAAASAPPLL